MQNAIVLISNGVVTGCQLLAIIIISLGIVKASFFFFQNFFSRMENLITIRKTRMELGSSFSLGLSFLIGASILKTTIAPTWNDIGQLSAIIAIRTVLNFFLMLEMEKHSKSGEEGSSASGYLGKVFQKKNK